MSYDANGSVTKKITWNTHSTTTDPINHTKIEEVTYEYNLQNRLKKVTTLPYDELGNPLTAQQSIVEYIYNTDGIRVQKIDDPDGAAETTIYLVDAYNHTGYAQTLEEMTFNVADPDPVNDIPAIRKTYTIGDDMLTEATAEYDSVWTYYPAEHLIYDGHGSTRQLVTGSVGSTSIVDDFSYDGYGVLLQNEGNFTPPDGTQVPGKVVQQATSLLYTGEHFDTDSRNYYLRARWYDYLSGRFNRMDPFAGSNQDPQSLHKYLYCHGNPANRVDPSGLFDSVDAVIHLVAIGILAAIIAPTLICWRGFRAREKRAMSENPELYERRVNEFGFWVGWVKSGSMSFFARLNATEGRIYNPYNPDGINAHIDIIGGAIGLGAGISAGDGAILIFNAYSLKDITKIGYWDPELSFDLFDPIPEGTVLKLLKRIGVNADELVLLRKFIRFKQFEKSVSTLEKIGSLPGIDGGKPTALLLNLETGLQLYLGLSYNEVFVSDPSFE